MKIYILPFLIFGFIIQSQAQTKLIAHKSHSGNSSNFKKALKGNLFDISMSNFGGGPLVRMKQRLDSLVKVDDTTVVMHMSVFLEGQYDTLSACFIDDREMIFTEYSNVEYEDDALDLLKNNTQFDFPITETKIVGYRTKGYEDIEVIPVNMPSHILNEQVDEEVSKLLPIKKKTKKELRKEKRILKKRGKVKEELEAKVCEKPSFIIPFFKEEKTIKKEKAVVIRNDRNHWLAITSLGLFSLLLGGITQYLRE